MRVWVDAIQKMVISSALIPSSPISKFFIARARWMYRRNSFQVWVGAIIFLNFAFNIFDAQSNPTVDSTEGQSSASWNLEFDSRHPLRNRVIHQLSHDGLATPIPFLSLKLVRLAKAED